MRKQEEKEIARITQIIAVEASNLGTATGSNSNPNLFPIPTPIITQAANMLYNSDASHSVSTWFDTVNSGGDRNEEAAYLFSNTQPVLGQSLSTAVTP